MAGNLQTIMRLPVGKFLGESRAAFSLEGLTFTYLTYSPRTSQPDHAHEEYSLFVLLSGDNRDKWSQNSFDLPAFSTRLTPSDQMHAIDIGDRGAIAVNIEFSRRWLDTHQISADALRSYRIMDSPQSQVASLRLVALSPWLGCNSTADSAVFELLEPFVERKELVEPASPRWLKRGEELLHSDFRKPIALREAAEAAGVCAVHFARVFRSKHGHSVGEYLHSLRVAEACRLIVDEGRPAGFAAHESGFYDQAHFSRTLAQKVGTTSSRLRAIVAGSG